MKDKACRNSMQSNELSYSGKNHDKNRTTLSDYLEFKICGICQQSLKTNEFHKNKNKLDGHDSICRVCVSKSKAKNYKEKKKKVSKLLSYSDDFSSILQGELTNDTIEDFIKVFEEIYRGLKYEGKI